MKVDQMKKTIPTDDDVWILRNPSYHQQIKPGKQKNHNSLFKKILENPFFI
jgi:hypothetical protein